MSEPDSQGTCPFCYAEIPAGAKGCSCGRNMEQIEAEWRALNRDANREMFRDMPDLLLDEPWGNR